MEQETIFERLQHSLEELIDTIRMRERELQELEQRREELLTTRRVLQGLVGNHESGPYVDLQIAEAAALALESAGRPLKTADIVDRLIKGGLQTKATNVTTTVYGVLHRESRGDEPKVIKTGAGEWGLPARDQPEGEESETVKEEQGDTGDDPWDILNADG